MRGLCLQTTTRCFLKPCFNELKYLRKEEKEMVEDSGIHIEHRHTKNMRKWRRKSWRAKACDLKKRRNFRKGRVLSMGWLCAVRMAREDGKNRPLMSSSCATTWGGKPFFICRAGLLMEKAGRGPYKWMMKMVSSVGAGLQKKANRTAEEEEEMLDLVLNGGDRVSREALEPLLRWGMAEK